MEKLTDKQKKYVWLGVATLALIHFAPRYIGTITHGVHATARKPSPIVVAVARPSSPALSKPTAPFTTLAVEPTLYDDMGVWGGEAITPDGNSCKLRLELSASKTQADLFEADSTLSCAPNIGMMRRLPVGNSLLLNELKAMKPVSGIFAGHPEDGALHLKVETALGDSNGCYPTDLFIRPFGQGGIATKWEQNSKPDGKCAPGDMIMRRAR